jgi:hypothetical protein
MDIEGIGGYKDDVRTLDMEHWNIASPHKAWYGVVQGNYPPTYPFWDPSSPKGTSLTNLEYNSLGSSDDDLFDTTTGIGSTGRYPFHLFRFQVPNGTVVGLSIRWEGYGQCLASAIKGGAEMFVWRNSTTAWVKVDSYAQAAAGERLMTKSWRGSQDPFIDIDRNVFVLVVGKPSELTTGPNPVVTEGEIHTDHILVNATLRGDWREAEDVDLTIAPSGELWAADGDFTGRVQLGPTSGLKEALQAAVDASAVLPSNITVPLVFTFKNVTSASIRLSNLSVVYDPVVNSAPTWIDLPVLEMYEDVDAKGLVDLDLYSDDDWSNTSLVYSVVGASTSAIEAVVEEDHNLSFYVRQADWNGRATFYVNVTDPWGLNTTSPALILDVIGVNDPPRASSPGRMFGAQDTPFYLDVIAIDVDGDPFTFSLDTDAFDIDPQTGVIDFTPTNEQVGLHRVTISIVDDQGGETMLALELTIVNVNDPPFIVDPGIIHGRQGEYLTYTFIVDDPDIIHGDLIVWTLEGDMSLIQDLEFSPVLGELVWRTPGNEDVGTHALTVRVRDSGDAVDVQEVLIIIANVNDPPTIAHVADIVTFEDGLLTHSIHANDPDLAVDPDEKLTWVVDPLLFQVAQDGSFTYRARHEDVGEHQMTVTVTDESGVSHFVTFLLVVKAINHMPEITPIPDQEAYEDVEWTIDIIISDADVGDTVQVGARGAPFHVPTTGGTIFWVPQERHGGEHLVTLTVSDGRGGRTVWAFNLTVITSNDPPTVEIRTPTEDAVVPGGGQLFLSSIAVDEEEDHMTFTWFWRYDDPPNSQWEKITTGPTGHWIDPPSGKLRVKVEVTDGEGTGTDEVVINVEPDTDDGGGSTILLLGIVALAAVALFLVFLVRTGRLGRPPDEPEPEAEVEDWEVVKDIEAVPPLHR